MTNKNEYVRLLSEAQSGNGESVAELVTLVRDPLYAFIYKRTRDHHCAEDLLQETLLAMIQHLSSLRRFESFWSWVRQIAWTKMQQYFRDRRRRVGLEVCLVQQYHQAQQTVRGDVLDALVHDEGVEALLNAIRQMEPRSRHILYLRCLRRVSCGEIASLVQSTPNGVRVQLYRARKLLKERMMALTA